MAHAAILYPTHLENDEYAYIVRQMKSTILKMFHLTHDAIKHYNQKDAKLVVKTYAGIKTLHDSLTHKINKDKNIEPNKAIVYALLTIYLRRIGAHLKNICTTILKPFPEIGFEKTYH
jgi:phosphate uptake regulator